MLPSRLGWCWLAVFVWGTGLMLPWIFRMKLRRELVWALATVGILVAWPWGTVDGVTRWRFAAVGMMGILAASRWSPLRVRGAVIGLVVSTAIFLLMPLYGAAARIGSHIGFQYGTEKIYSFMVTGSGAFQHSANANDLLPVARAVG